MAVTGNGTEDSPFIVSTYSELVERAAIEDTFIEISKEVGTINIEDEFGHEEPPELAVAAAANINGNGCKIRGLWGRNHTLIHTIGTSSGKDKTSLKNLIFDSLYASGGSLIGDVFGTSYRYNQLEIDNCIFSGVCDSTLLNLRQAQSTNGKPRGTVIKNSSMNIQLKSVDNPKFAEIIRGGSVNQKDVELTLSNSIIKLSSSGDITLFTRADGNSSNYVHTESWNCLFDPTAAKISLSDNLRCVLSGCMFLGESSGGIDLSNVEPDAVCVYNNNVFPNTEEIEKFVGVSEDRLSDSVYLSNLGFPIAGDIYG